LLECVCEIYNIYHSWQCWRSSMFTIHVIWKFF
jgi:hypothetical protein